MDMIAWLEAHEKLAGWAQFAGAMAALVVTYLTAFVPIWMRKKSLRKAATRLLNHGHEVLESYYRTTPNFLPTSLSLRGGVLMIDGIIDEIARFPVYDLDDHGPKSLARCLAATSAVLLGVRLVFENMISTIGNRDATGEERDILVEYLGQQLEIVRKMLAGEPLVRPVWKGSLA